MRNFKIFWYSMLAILFILLAIWRFEDGKFGAMVVDIMFVAFFGSMAACEYKKD